MPNVEKTWQTIQCPFLGGPPNQVIVVIGEKNAYSRVLRYC